jgi:hypothetical protein
MPTAGTGGGAPRPVGSTPVLGHPLGGGVHEEVGERAQHHEHLCRHCEAGQFGGAEPADDDGVGRGIQGLDGERTERRHGERPDGPIDRISGAPSAARWLLGGGLHRG